MEHLLHVLFPRHPIPAEQLFWPNKYIPSTFSGGILIPRHLGLKNTFLIWPFTQLLSSIHDRIQMQKKWIERPFLPFCFSGGWGCSKINTFAEQTQPQLCTCGKDNFSTIKCNLGPFGHAQMPSHTNTANRPGVRRSWWIFCMLTTTSSTWSADDGFLGPWIHYTPRARPLQGRGTLPEDTSRWEDGYRQDSGRCPKRRMYAAKLPSGFPSSWVSARSHKATCLFRDSRISHLVIVLICNGEVHLGRSSRDIGHERCCNGECRDGTDGSIDYVP